MNEKHIVVGSKTRYLSGVMRWITTKRLPLLLFLIISLMLGLTFSARLSVSWLKTSMIEGAEPDMISASDAFAGAVHEWIINGSHEHLARGVELMLLGSARQVHVSYMGETLILAYDSGWEHLSLKPLTTHPVAATTASFRVDDRLVFDTIIPIRNRAEVVGFVRLASHAQLLETRISQMTAGAIVASAIVGLVLAVLGCRAILRLPARQSVPATEPTLGRELRETLLPQTLVVDLSAKTVSRNGSKHTLTPKLFSLLSLLVDDPAKVYSDKEIIDFVWPEARYIGANDVHQCVYRLRKCLNQFDPELGDYVSNIKGFGYRFTGPVIVQSHDE